MDVDWRIGVLMIRVCRLGWIWLRNEMRRICVNWRKLKDDDVDDESVCCLLDFYSP